MKEYIAFDSHKHYTLMERESRETGKTRQVRIEHAPGAIRRALAGCETGTPVALEATGNWYWIAEEIEEAGLATLLVHPRKAKLMMGMVNKTDRLDVHGLNTLQRNGTLPTVWIPPAPLRDLRALTRARVRLGWDRTRLKCLIHAVLAQYGQQMGEAYSDIFTQKARAELTRRLGLLPPNTQYVAFSHWERLEALEDQIRDMEKRIASLVKADETMRLLDSLPGIGAILSAAIALEVGDIERFPDHERYAAYAGLTPRVHASGGKVRYGRCRSDVNRTLKWAYSEAANSVALNHTRKPDLYVSRQYRAVRKRRNHSVAIGAVARHLAESSYHVLSRKEPYRDPAESRAGRAREAQARHGHTRC